jgi:hypothetical protein
MKGGGRSEDCQTIPIVNRILRSTSSIVCRVTLPKHRSKREVSSTRTWWHSTTESLLKPPSPAETCTQDGKAARRRLVVKGIAKTVDVKLLILSFWKIKTGRTPACSEPRTGFRSASQTSPRLSLNPYPQQAAGLDTLPFLPRPAHDPPLRTRRKAPQVGNRQR